MANRTGSSFSENVGNLLLIALRTRLDEPGDADSSTAQDAETVFVDLLRDLPTFLPLEEQTIHKIHAAARDLEVIVAGISHDEFESAFLAGVDQATLSRANDRLLRFVFDLLHKGRGLT